MSFYYASAIRWWRDYVFGSFLSLFVRFLLGRYLKNELFVGFIINYPSNQAYEVILDFEFDRNRVKVTAMSQDWNSFSLVVSFLFKVSLKAISGIQIVTRKIRLAGSLGIPISTVGVESYLFL